MPWMMWCSRADPIPPPFAATQRSFEPTRCRSRPLSPICCFSVVETESAHSPGNLRVVLFAGYQLLLQPGYGVKQVVFRRNDVTLRPKDANQIHLALDLMYFSQTKSRGPSRTPARKMATWQMHRLIHQAKS